jgi:hypothetical protein
MSLSRRKFIQSTLLGTASFATTSGIFFPKPAEAYSLDFNLSQSTSSNIFNDVLSYTDIQLLGETLSSTEQVIGAAVQFTEEEFIQRQFTQDKTPFANTDLSIAPGVLWGRQKQETLGPNAGFATVQTEEGEPIRATFSGSTTVGLHGAVRVLADQRLSPSDISKYLIPTRVQFEDWGTWEGDVAGSSGSTSSTSLTSYRTRRGEVFRQYRLIEPGPGGFGVIHMVIEGELEPRRDITITVKFT